MVEPKSSQDSSQLGDVPSGVSRLPHRSKGVEQAAWRATWLLISVLTFFAVWYLVPAFAERMQYAAARGKQRAELEAATQGLESVQLDVLSRAFQMVSKRVGPTVVNINVVGETTTVPQDDLATLFGPTPQPSQGQGSGVIVDASGYILTNYHVVRGATRIEVSLSDGRVLPAHSVGDDQLTDLALLKVEASELAVADWANSDAVEVGALVWAVGSPFGLQHSITAGIISGKNRPGGASTVYYDFLQTDAAVNPGNSGGPLVDTHGRIVGINTAILGEVFQGISFAIPSNEAREVYEKLRAEGQVARGWLGVGLADIDPAMARQMGFSSEQGVLVDSVTAGSPAERAGIRRGDIITSWDGHPAGDRNNLSRLVARTRIASQVQVQLWRRGEEVTLTVAVGKRPAELR
ncbi:MAG: S1C family serine protease [Pirellulaceae bacterium]